MFNRYYITQLIYLTEGQEKVFDEFEALAIPIIAKYNGELLLRFKPGVVIEQNMEVRYEVHIVNFPTEKDFDQFKKDESRKAFLHMKEQSVKTAILLSGKKI